MFIKVLFQIGIGFPINTPHLLALQKRRIEESRTKSQIWTDTAVVKLIQAEPYVGKSRVTGAIVRRGADDYEQINALQVVLATGGWQGSNELRSRYIGFGADNIFVRSNAGSVGDGLQLATSAGAGTSRGMSSYYGHLLPAPLREEDVSPEEFLALAQYREYPLQALRTYSTYRSTSTRKQILSSNQRVWSSIR